MKECQWYKVVLQLSCGELQRLEKMAVKWRTEITLAGAM